MWQERGLGDLLLLNPAQERNFWTGILRDGQYLPTVVPASLHRMAAMAMDAQELLCSFAPQFLSDKARAGWDQDPGAFNLWLAAFDRACAKDGLHSPSRAPLHLISTLHADTRTRAPLLLAGFDRMLPIQRDLFNAWGDWRPLVEGA